MKFIKTHGKIKTKSFSAQNSLALKLQDCNSHFNKLLQLVSNRSSFENKKAILKTTCVRCRSDLLPFKIAVSNLFSVLIVFVSVWYSREESGNEWCLPAEFCSRIHRLNESIK